MTKVLRILEELYKLINSIMDRSVEHRRDIKELQDAVLALGSKIKLLEEKQNIINYDKKMH